MTSVSPVVSNESQHRDESISIMMSDDEAK